MRGQAQCSGRIESELQLEIILPLALEPASADDEIGWPVRLRSTMAPLTGVPLVDGDGRATVT